MLREKDSFKDISIASHQYTKERDYWVNQLSGDLIKSSFPYDYTPGEEIDKPGQENEGKIEFCLDRDIFSQLMKLSKGYDYTLHMILVTAVVILLARYSGNKDIILGMPIYRQDSEEEFVNTVLALRNHLEDHVAFKDLLLQVRQTVIDADQNQNYAIETLLYQLNIPAAAPDFPLFDTAVLLENVHDKSYMDHINLNTVFCFHRREDLINGVLEYNAGRYREETARQIVTHLICLLKRVLADITVDIDTVEFLTPEEKKKLLFDFNAAEKEFAYEKTIVELFADQVVQTPDHIALFGQVLNTLGVGHLSYRQLNEKSNQLAHLLKEKGVKPNNLVGIMTDRTVDTVIGIVGILKSGGAYLPIDPETPITRIESILDDAGVSIVLAKKTGFDELTFNRMMEAIMADNGKRPGREVLTPETLAGILPGSSEKNPPDANQSVDLAYSVFTSGSTGKPKGVMIRHYNVHNLVVGLKLRIYERYGAGYLKLGLVSPFVFDASIKQIFAALLQGYGLCVVPEEVRVDAGRLFAYYRQHFIDAADGTPAHLTMLTAAMEETGLEPGVKHFLIGGEALPRRVLEDFFNRFPTGAPLPIITNVYGPSECTVDTTTYDISPDNIRCFEVIPIGKPMPNCRVYILDSKKNLVPMGVPGELCIGGASVGQGYIKDEALTAAKFIPDPFKPGGQLYFTGDLARWLPDGNVQFLGRSDQQVKIRGFRIELKEIETCLLKHKKVKEAVVVTKKGPGDDACICAYTVSHKGISTPEPKGKDPSGKIVKTHKEFCLKELNPAANIGQPGLFPGYKPGDSNQPLVKWLEDQSLKYSNEIAVSSSTGTLTYDSLNRSANQLARLINKTYDDRYQLSNEERTRYKRQILLDGWGIEAQEKLKSTTVCVVGAGGIGSMMIQQLALLGIGTMIICDYDEVELSNLNRQVLHDETRIGMNKAESAKLTINRINPYIKVVLVREKVTGENVSRIVGDAAVIFDCVDDLETKFILSGCAVEKQVPHVLSAMMEINSYAAILYPPQTPCFHCLHDRSKAKEIKEVKHVVKDYKKNPFPVASPALFVTTGFACNEAVKIIIGTDKPAYNKFFFFNQKGSKRIVETTGYRQMSYSFNQHFKKICKRQGFDWDECWRSNFLEELHIEPDPHCPVCAGKTWEPIAADKRKSPDPAPGVPGVQDKTRPVAALLEDDINVIPAVIGVLKAGNTYVPLDPAIPGKRLIEIIEDSGTRLIITDNTNYNTAVELRNQVNKHIPVININEIDRTIPGENLNLEISPDRAAVILYEQVLSPEMLEAELKDYLARELPAYMLPSFLIHLDKIPLTANGKLDKKALPEPGIKQGKGYVAPRNEWETKLAEIWSQLLGIEKNRLGIDDNFFEMGGHSLKATILISRIHKLFDVKIPLAEIFRMPFIRELAGKIRGAGSQHFYAVPPVEKKQYYPLTPAMKGLYFEQQMDTRSIVYNISNVVVLEGKLENSRLEKVFRKLIRRHESLRTSFQLLEGEPVQRVHDEVDFQIEYFKINRVEVEVEDEGTSGQPAAVVISSFFRPFDLSRAPLFRAGLVKTGEMEHLLMVSIHHTVADGTSIGILMSQFMALYDNETLPDLRVQYKDFSQWRNQRLPEDGQLMKKYEDYWLKEFRGEIPVLNLPWDYSRPAVRSFEGAVVESILDEKITGRLRDLALAEDVTLYMLGLSAFNVLLMKLSGQEDIVVGTPIAGRNHADLEPLIGMFVNTLAMRNYPAGSKTFRQFLQEVRERTLQAFAHQDYGFEKLVKRVMAERRPGRNPIFDVFFAVQNMERPYFQVPGLQLRPYEYDTGIARFDLVFHVFEQGDQLNIAVDYCTHLFKKETVEMFIKNFNEIAAAVLEDPDIHLQDIDISTEVIKAVGHMPQVDLGF
ncbi:MAG: amino acid adenylation domain-containing protein [Candidatus Aminicenantes bacterium]|nr:MAG: amino acid adenylation domain-containing protein [Candidatus Aminicenantes bacterium]